MPRSGVAVGLVVLGLVLGLAVALLAPDPTQSQTIEWLENPRSLSSFHLHSESDRFDNQALMGQWSIVLFGFLNCPDVCPTSMAELADLAAGVQAAATKHPVEFVFVSVDPGRDAVHAVHEYARAFSPAIRGVTGTSEQLTRFARDLGTVFKVVADSADYTVSHAITFSVIDPSGRLRARFRPGFDQPRLLQNLLTKLSEVST